MIAADVCAQVAESRRRQGLPPCIEDELLLTQLAAILVLQVEASEAA